jgi:hypothetical protein
MKITGKAQQLADEMIRLSIKYYATEWMMGIEFELWNEVLGNQDLLTEAEASKLKDLSTSCDGWISMNFSDDNLEFISLSGWKKTFREKNPF